MLRGGGGFKFSFFKGFVIALITGGAGMATPEMRRLASIFKMKGVGMV